MTDSTGLIQHSIYDIPRRESGYTTDDNARALRLCTRLYDEQPDERMLNRIACYLSFLEHARCPGGGFHNFMSFQREWLDHTGCGDSQGQTVLALAQVVGGNLPAGFRDLARELIKGAVPVLAELTSLRAHAYVVQAFAVLRRADVADMGDLERVAKQAADRLAENYHHSQQPDWPWFEPRMTYANAVLPHAMFDAAEQWPDEDFLQIAETAFHFLDQSTTVNDDFWPIGNLGWFAHGRERSSYDQQPVEASTMAAAALTGLRMLHDQSYLVTFHRARGWFRGQNSLKYPMADTVSGGCMDGLEAAGVNRNQGAESTLAYLWTELLASDAHRMSQIVPPARTVSSQQFLKLHR